MESEQDCQKRFWSKVLKTNNCWLWQGYITKSRDGGYGLFCARARRFQAHRFALEITNGPIPENYFACHKCDVRQCVRPDHLFLGTSRDNIEDMKEKRRCAGRVVLTPRQFTALATKLHMPQDDLSFMVEQIKKRELLTGAR